MVKIFHLNYFPRSAKVKGIQTSDLEFLTLVLLRGGWGPGSRFQRFKFSFCVVDPEGAAEQMQNAEGEPAPVKENSSSFQISDHVIFQSSKPCDDWTDIPFFEPDLSSRNLKEKWNRTQKASVE